MSEGQQMGTTTPVGESAETKKVSTTDFLFPEDIPTGEPTDEKEVENVVEDSEAAKAEEFLNVDEFSEKKLKLKINGVEEEAPLKDVIRRVQTDQAITQKAQRVAEKEKELAARERALIESLASKPKGTTAEVGKEGAEEYESIFKDDPLVKRTQSELERLNKQMNEQQELLKALQAQTQETRYHENVKRLASRIEAELGQKDFLDYEPKIRAYIQSLPPEEGMKADTADGWIAHYLRLKVTDPVTVKNATKKEEPKSGERTVQRPPRVESGASRSSSQSDDWDAKYQKAFERAREASANGEPRAAALWAEVTRLKRESE